MACKDSGGMLCLASVQPCMKIWVLPCLVGLALQTGPQNSRAVASLEQSVLQRRETEARGGQLAGLGLLLSLSSLIARLRAGRWHFLSCLCDITKSFNPC